MASFLDLPLEALSSILEFLDIISRVALVSTCTVLRDLGASSPDLWVSKEGSLHIQLPEERLPKLAAWLRSRSSMIQSLSMEVQLAQGELPNVGPALAPLTRLTALRLEGSDGGQGPVTLKASTWNFLQQLPLRRLSLDFGDGLTLLGSFDTWASLETLEIGPLSHVMFLTLPPSLVTMSLPLELVPGAMAEWDDALNSAPGLQELYVFCRWKADAVEALMEFMAFQDPEDIFALDLSELRQLTPGLQQLTVDCSLISQQGGMELGLRRAEQLPPGLRSLTATHLGHSSQRFLQGLRSLEHLTRLCLSQCRLVDAPGVLQGLTRLQELQLGGCGQGGVGASLAALRALPSLQRLSLQGCSLRQLGDGELGEGWPALEELDLAHAKLPQRQGWLAGLSPQVTRLGLDVYQAAKHPAELASLSALRRLDLHLFKPTVMPALQYSAGSGTAFLPAPPAPEMYQKALPALKQVVVPALLALPSLAELGLPRVEKWGRWAGKVGLFIIRQRVKPLLTRTPRVAVFTNE